MSRICSPLRHLFAAVFTPAALAATAARLATLPAASLLPMTALALLSMTASAREPEYRIEAVDHQAVVATLRYEVHATEATVTRWLAFVPEPPALPSQTDLVVQAEPVGKVVREKSPLARPVRFIDLSVRDARSAARLALTLEIRATLRSRRLVPLGPGEKAPTVPPLSAVEHKLYRASDARADYDTKAFREWLDAKRLRAVRGESPFELAARVLDVIRSDYDYAYDPRADRRASVVCRQKTADCGGMSCLFVAVMRANGIPARLLVGRVAESSQPGSLPGSLEYDRPHARAEFFVAGVGWVPVDPAYANQDLMRPVEEFVGYDPGDLLVLHVDADLKLPFPDEPRTAELLQLAPAVWVHAKGKPDLILAPATWQVTTTPIRRN